MAVGLTGLINVFDPDTVVGGGLFSRILPDSRVSSMPNSPAAAIHGHAAATFPSSVRRSERQAVTVGAAELAFHELVDDPARIIRGVAGSVAFG